MADTIKLTLYSEEGVILQLLLPNTQGAINYITSGVLLSGISRVTMERIEPPKQPVSSAQLDAEDKYGREVK